MNDSDLSYLRACGKPRLIVQGDQDQFGSRERFEALVASFPDASRAQAALVFIADADHFFTGQLDQLDAAISSWLLHRQPYLTPAAKSSET